MKRLIIILFYMPCAMAHAQNDLFGGRPASETSALGVQEARDISGKPVLVGDNSPITGTPMLSDKFVSGSVQFKANNKTYNLMLDFSLFENQLYFQKDSNVLKFADPVYEFGLVVNNKNGIGKTVLNFKKDYPEVGNNTNETFYQVVSDGSRLQLLKYLYKTIENRHDYSAPLQKAYVLKEKLFIYDVKNKTIAEINPNINSLEKAIPEYTVAIENFDSKSKIKNENEVNKLVESINNNEVVTKK